MANNSDKIIKYGVGALAIYTVYGLALQGSLGDDFKKAALELRKIWTRTPGNVITGNPDRSSNSSNQSQQQSPSTSPNTQPASTTPVNSWLPTALRDFGGVPIVYNPATGVLKQDPAWVAQFAPGYSPNSYSSGVFQTTDGQWFNYQGNGRLLPNDGGQLVDIRAFIVAV